MVLLDTAAMAEVVRRNAALLVLCVLVIKVEILASVAAALAQALRNEAVDRLARAAVDARVATVGEIVASLCHLRLLPAAR